MKIKALRSVSVFVIHTSNGLINVSLLKFAISFKSKFLDFQMTNRDLKTDSILLTFNQSSDMPWLVVTDFGFCLTSLSLPFNSDEVCRGCNRALIAPEIIGANPDLLTSIDYFSSDLWAIGAIAY